MEYGLYYLAPMARKLSQMSTEDMLKEMSIAGSPGKITDLMTDIDSMIWERVNKNSIPELINIEFALDRIKAEVRLCKRKAEKRHSVRLVADINKQKEDGI
jgi:hypothetical protein